MIQFNKISLFEKMKIFGYLMNNMATYEEIFNDY
jgi:hypothetical protein